MGDFTNSLYFIQRLREGQQQQRAAQDAAINDANARGNAQQDEAFQREQSRKDQLALQAGQVGADTSGIQDPRLAEIAGLGAQATRKQMEDAQRAAAQRQALEGLKQGQETGRVLGKQGMVNEGAMAREKAIAQNRIDVANIMAKARVASAGKSHQGGKPEWAYTIEPAIRSMLALHAGAAKELDRLTNMQKGNVLLQNDPNHQAAIQQAQGKVDKAILGVRSIASSIPGLSPQQRDMFIQSMIQQSGNGGALGPMSPSPQPQAPEEEDLFGGVMPPR